jgi:hypothetical protein
VKLWLKPIALIAFGGYVVWNAGWLLYGQIPPSILQHFTGLPGPTTGMTRSLLSLYQGDWKNFLFFNPLTSVYLALTGVSSVILVKQKISAERWVLPAVLARLWLVALALGWLLKFVIGSKYW